MYAILRAGGKQLKVSPGDVVRVERPSEKVEKGQQLSLSGVVFVGGGKQAEGDSERFSVKAIARTISTLHRIIASSRNNSMP